MDSFTSLEDRQSNYGPEHEAYIRLLYKQRDELVDDFNEMIHQSNTVLMDLDWYEEDVSAEMATVETAEQPGAQTSNESSLPTAETDLKVEVDSLKSTDTADNSPSENGDKKTGIQQADCSTRENVEKRTPSDMPVESGGLAQAGTSLGITASGPHTFRQKAASETECEGLPSLEDTTVETPYRGAATEPVEIANLIQASSKFLEIDSGSFTFRQSPWGEGEVNRSDDVADSAEPVESSRITQASKTGSLVEMESLLDQ